MRRDPHQFGIERSRWTLAHLLACCRGLRLHSRCGLWRLLHRLGIHDKRARSTIHSPDPAYDEKVARIKALQQRVQAHPEEVLLYEDECTLYRQPSVAHAYDQVGSDRPHACQSTQRKISMRLVATLDAFSGRVLFKRWGTIGTKQLSAFYQFVRASYPTATRIWLIQDNWPLHFHPDVLLGLEPQERWYPVKMPRQWTHEPTQEAQRQWGTTRLPIQLVQLPTYASWWNRIEKLWRKLKQERLHVHPWADDPPAWRAQINAFFQQCATGSPDLLQYVGLHLPY